MKEGGNVIYKMSVLMFTELSKALKQNGRNANQAEVIAYMNQTFGLNHDVTELHLI